MNPPNARHCRQIEPPIEAVAEGAPNVAISVLFEAKAMEAALAERCFQVC